MRVQTEVGRACTYPTSAHSPIQYYHVRLSCVSTAPERTIGACIASERASGNACRGGLVIAAKNPQRAPSAGRGRGWRKSDVNATRVPWNAKDDDQIGRAHV